MSSQRGWNPVSRSTVHEPGARNAPGAGLLTRAVILASSSKGPVREQPICLCRCCAALRGAAGRCPAAALADRRGHHRRSAGQLPAARVPGGDADCPRPSTAGRSKRTNGQCRNTESVPRGRLPRPNVTATATLDAYADSYGNVRASEYADSDGNQNAPADADDAVLRSVQGRSERGARAGLASADR